MAWMILTIITVIYLFTNFSISMWYDVRKVNSLDCVGPKVSVLFAPLYIRNCTQHKYTTIEDELVKYGYNREDLQWMRK